MTMLSLLTTMCLAAGAPSPLEQPTAQWIWSTPDAATNAPNQTLYFRLDIDLPADPEAATVLITADNTYTLYINGFETASGNNWKQPTRRDVTGALRKGRNVIAVEAGNGGGPAGLYLSCNIETADGALSASSSDQWRWSDKKSRGWNVVDGGTGDWKQAAVLGVVDISPWSLNTLLDSAVDLPPVTKPTDWTQWRQRQRDTLSAIETPADPPGDKDRHPIDRWMEAWWSTENVGEPALCDDATFTRRAYFDIVGLPPTERQLAWFVSDQAFDKRERLVDSLLADDASYAEGWMAWWCDLLRNDEQTNIDNLRKPVTRWLFTALEENRPYDRMVAELLNPGPVGPDGYLKGVNWRGTVNASQTPPMQAAQNVGQVFMGTNIKCASCHDHFTRPYMLEDSYGLASFFSEKNLEMHRCDKPMGKVVGPVFPLRELGKVSPDADLATRHAAVAEMVTTPRNPRFAKTMVNRLWQKLIGRGLFEPVDDVYAKPANAELLEWLAYEFMTNDYDLKHVIRLITTSKAYQLRSAPESGDQQRKSDKEPGIFTSIAPRRLSSEQFLDALSVVTGYWPSPQTMNVEVSNPNVRAWRHRIPGPLALALGRPNREQVATCREEDASMLQMLEMVNGKVLANLLSEGAKRLLESPLGQNDDIDAVIDTLYHRSLARPASAQEKQLLGPLLGRPNESLEQRQPGWEDACWMLAMSPEFQYIR